MRERTLRTIGASVVLVGVAIAAWTQSVEASDPVPAELVAAEPSTSEAGPASTVAAAPSTSAPEPFIYRVGVLSSVTTDNFWSYYGAEPSVWNSYILGPTKPALYSLDPVTGGLQPELIRSDAEATWDENGWRVRIDLSEGFEWSDGQPITAHDFVYTFETVRALGLGGSWSDAYPSTIESVHADGDYRLRIEFTERPNLRVWPHGVGLAPVMAKHIWSDKSVGITSADLYAMSGAGDVSGGPLHLVVASANLAVSNANPGYPRPGGPDVVEYHVYADDQALVTAVSDGEIDSVLTPQGIAPDTITALEGDASVTVVANQANGIRYLGFNLQRAPMSDRAFRSAVALLIDREALAGEVGGATSAAWTFISNANTQWFDPAQAEATEAMYDGDTSARLAVALDGLRTAGYEWDVAPSLDAAGSLVAGTGLTIDGQTPQPLTILTPGDEYDPARPDYVENIAEVLRVLGFDTRPVATDFDSVVDLAFTADETGNRHYDMYLLGWTLGSPDLPEFYRPFFASGGAMNNTGYSSSGFNQALARFESAYTHDEARAAVWAMEQTLATDLPYLLLYSSQLTEVYRSDRVSFGVDENLGGIQGRLGGIGDVQPAD